MTTEMLKIDLPKNQSSIIKVMGIGGGGGNAVNHMFRQGIKGVDFVVCNTDNQHLLASPVHNKIQLGVALTQGMGAGSIPNVGREAALEDIERVKEILNANTKMVFITAGMGGGTGTGAAPVIAQVAKEMGILTVGIVTIPFSFEGRKRLLQAQEGIKEMKEQVDTLIVICNDKLRELYGNLPYSESLAKADDVLSTAAKGIAEIITQTGNINVDFADVKTVMSQSGVALMGNGVAEGEDRALHAVEMAISSPLLNDNNIKGAKYVLLNITSGKEEILMDEITLIADYVQNEAGSSADIIWGLVKDESLGSKISITLLATGFENRKPELSAMQPSFVKQSQPKTTTPADVFTNSLSGEPKIVHKLLDSPEEHKPSVSEIFEFDNKPRIIGTLDIANAERNVDFAATRLPERPRVVEQTLFPKEPISSYPHNEISSDKKREREEMLKSLSQKIKTVKGLNDVEDEPAFIRRNVQLISTPHSSETQLSRLSIGQDSDKQVQIKSNNSFLHDNVD